MSLDVTLQTDPGAISDDPVQEARRQIEIRRIEEEARAAAEATRAAQEQYDRDYAAWREQVRLCQSGFREACTARPAWARPQQ